MENKCSSPLDRLSELPISLSRNILMLLPIRDMARTSVLSKHWRYQWAKVPQLVFEDDPMYVVSGEERYRYNAMKVVEILLLHHGPILKIILDMTAWPVCSALNSIIPFLSRNGIKELTLLMPNHYADRHKLSPSMLSSLNLRYLSLSTFELRPPCIANFNNLVSLELSNVVLDPGASISSCPFLETLVLNFLAAVNLLTIDAPNLKKLHLEGGVVRIGIMNTPLLKVLWLFTDDRCYTGNSSSDFMSLLLSLPLLEDLVLTYEFLLVLAVVDTRDKLPKLLNNLRMLLFHCVDLCDMKELAPVLWFMRSSPNLRKIKFSAVNLPVPVTSIIEAGLYMKMQDHSDYSLTKLQEVEMVLSTKSSDVARVIAFSKFILDISPALETLRIEPDLKQMDGDGYKKLVDLACHPRASSKAKIVYAGLESAIVTLG